MFDKFGEMGSFKEINELAENLFNEGDIDSLKAMARRERDTERLCGHVSERKSAYAVRCYDSGDRENRSRGCGAEAKRNHGGLGGVPERAVPGE